MAKDYYGISADDDALDAYTIHPDILRGGAVFRSTPSSPQSIEQLEQILQDQPDDPDSSGADPDDQD